MERDIAILHFINQGDDPHKITSQIESYLRGGGKWVQLRMKNSSDDCIVACGKEALMLCKKYGAILVINDNPLIAKAIGADGVHLGKSDISTAKAREILGAGKIIGRTANTIDDIISLNNEDIDYIGLGPFRFTQTKKNLSPTLGIDGYKQIFSTLSEKEINSVPVVAIGGITLDDIELFSGVGISGIALSGEIGNAENIEHRTMEVLKKLSGTNLK